MNEQQTPETRAEGEPRVGLEPGSPADELEAARREIEELRDKYLRALADARNIQQRAQRDREQLLRYAEQEFARDLLVVLDDLERAQASIAGGAPPETIAEGVRIVCEHFQKVLSARKVEPIEALGKPFDPDVHEAMMQQPSDQYPAGTVMQELARGYRMHERVIRPARVVVSTGPAK